ncbi:MAG: hypothetical protein QNJ19_13555 [Woeseiaceae bacterium]|nr:hypothetical protein [Woeseiaceae bacterium]
MQAASRNPDSRDFIMLSLHHGLGTAALPGSAIISGGPIDV